MAITDAGENKAWELLAGCDPADVCRRAGVLYDAESGLYRVESFGGAFSVHPVVKKIRNLGPEGEILLTRLGYFFRLSLLWYLVKAATAQPSGKLLKPSGLPGGDLFFQGSHILPLEAVAKRYAADKDGFVAKGLGLGGRRVDYGDAAMELHPLPQVPTTLILWTEDEEFPARADLLFDATAPQHLPLDILWSVAMMSVLLFI